MQKKELILLALDETPFRMLVQRALRAAGYETAEASDREALQRALQESSPSLLLIGEFLRGEPGLKLASEQLGRFPTLPIILYVEKDSGETAKQVLTAGLSAYIFPPLRTEDIVDSVTRSLARARHLGDWVRREVRRTTSTLQKQVHELDAIFQNLGDGVIILNQRGGVLLINRTIQRIFGVNETSVVGVPFEDAFSHPDLLEVWRSASVGHPEIHEINMTDGRVFMARHAPIPEIGSAITLQDISHLKELERVKNDFVHTVSHDLRSPLTSVLGYAELVARTGPLNDHQREFLSRVQGSVQQITSLINDLLDIGRMEAGFDTRREAVHLETILASTLEALNGQIRAANMRVDLQISPSLPPVRANPIRIRQLLDNLINNALKYTPHNGIIRIELCAEEGQVIFQISDNGPGIAPADQPHIFDKFYRGADVPDGVVGTGLGLAIVKSIVDSHQGRIWVESAIGKGSAFYVVLPAEA
ncbi:MAG: Adaptive-response sensory-kinase SasA [Anaerolineales bacterium]|nr:Adaptive-response sensory-kinase SasA [Anaerolineales bacterium]